MNASEAFLALDRAGLSVRADGARLCIEPATLLRHEMRALARDHRAELLTLARDSEDRAAVAVERARRTTAVWHHQ